MQNPSALDNSHVMQEGKLRARRIIEGAAFGPEVLKVVMQAFDQAWESVSSNFSPNEHEHARAELADAMMNVAREDSADVERLREAGVRAIALKYPSRFGGLPQTGQNTRSG
jgi:hypothetical protein